MNQGSIIIFSGVLSLGLSGCLDHLGTAVRTTCLTDNDCADTDLGVRCLPLVGGRIPYISSLADHVHVWGAWKSNYDLDSEFGVPETSIGVPKICDVDFDEDGIADVMVKDHFYFEYEDKNTSGSKSPKQESCGSAAWGSDELCGTLIVEGLTSEGPCDAYPGLVLDDTPTDTRKSPSNRCFPPLVTRE